MFYLLNIGVSGIKGIKNEVQLDFYKKTVDKNFNPEKYRIKAIYGENGSGKSALITAVKIFKDLCLQESYLLETKNQDFLREMINKSTKEFIFHCEFLEDLKAAKEIYYYEVVLGLNNRGNFEIQHEMLKVRKGNYANSPYKTIFEISGGSLALLDANEQERKLAEKKSLNLLKTRSLVHIATMMCTESGNSKVFGEASAYILAFSIFPKCLIVITQNEQYGISEKTVDKEHFEEYQKRIYQLTQFLKIFKPTLVSIDVDKKESRDAYKCDLRLNYDDYFIDIEYESSGIKKLIRLFEGFTMDNTQGIVFIDEMDSNLNEVYLCRLLQYFKYYGKGQLCFTAHNVNLMSMLRDNKNSIEFLSGDNKIISWTARGNATPENYYRNGMIENVPFNVDATDFIGVF